MNEDYSTALEELKKVPIGIHERGVHLKGYDPSIDDEEMKTYMLENNNMYGLLFDYICNHKYKINADTNARGKLKYKIKDDPDAKFKLKDGAYGAWSFTDFRYKKKYNNNELSYDSYLNWLGSQLFDGDFDAYHYDKNGQLVGNITYEQAAEYSQKIMKRLYNRLCKYPWFVCVTESTSAKGIHIYTSSEIHDVSLIKNDKGYLVYDNNLTDEKMIIRKIKMYQLNYQIKLYIILSELKDIWDELDLEKIKPLKDFFDDAMYKPEQPMNITPKHKGRLLLNPNFKQKQFDEIYQYIYDDEIFGTINIDKYKGEIGDWVIEHTKQTAELDLKESDLNHVIKYKYISKSFTKNATGNKLENCYGPFYFGHGKHHDDLINGQLVRVPTIEQMIHTMKCIWDDDTIIDIWKMDNFYNQDAEEAGVIRWIQNYTVVDKKNHSVVPRDEWVPSNEVIEFLNTYCGFNIRYGKYTIARQKGDFIDIKLNDDEYLGDVFDDILKNIGTEKGIYLIKSGTGTGKTVAQTDRKDSKYDDILNYLNHKPTLMTEPYNSIITTKLTHPDIIDIVGTKHFKVNLNESFLYVTNYVHFSQLTKEQWIQFDYIVIDESHLMTTEPFRGNQLIEFINKVKEISNDCIVIVQTATPLDEYRIWDIKKTFNIIKKDKRHKSYKYFLWDYKKHEKTFQLEYLYNIIKQKLDDGIKTYVYCSNVSLDKANALAMLFEDEHKVAIYHKKIKERGQYSGSSMEFIDKNHIMGDYELLISSVYFGVGNDLNDELDDACCIIVSNNLKGAGNPYSEDVQVPGRFRNAKNIKVLSIIQSVNESNGNYNRLLRYKEKNIRYNFNDKTNRNNSIVIRDSTFKIDKEEDIPLWAILSVSLDYWSNINVKNSKLSEYFDDFDEEVYEFEPDLSKVTVVKEYMKRLSAERLNMKNQYLVDLLKGKENNYTGINKFDDWYRSIKRLYYNVPSKVFISVIEKIVSNQMRHRIMLFNEILQKYKDKELDYGEIAAFEWYKNSIEEGDSKDTKLEKMIYSYLIWYCYHNYNVSDYKVLGNYWSAYKWKCMNYYEILPELRDYLFNGIDSTEDIDNMIEFTSGFIYDDLKCQINKIEDEVILDYNPSGKITGLKNCKEDIENILKRILEYENSKRTESRKIGGMIGSPKKSVIITGKFKQLDKYNLKIGQIFMSCSDLASFTHKSNQTISTWMKKEWISTVL